MTTRAPTTPLWARGATPRGGSRPSDSVFWGSERLDQTKESPAYFVVASDGSFKDIGMTDSAMPGRWPDGGRRTYVAGLTRRRAAPAYVSKPDFI